jgi:C1A family cysteine protease
VCGGQAVIAVGYDDRVTIGTQQGALLIRSSWGHDWGDEGHGWLPYAFTETRLAADFWTVFRKDWLEAIHE